MWIKIEGANRATKQQQNDIAALRKQMTNVQNQGMAPADKRAWMNEATRKLADKYRFIHDIIEDTNTNMSKAVNRSIRIGMPINWQKGPEQFTD